MAGWSWYLCHHANPIVLHNPSITLEISPSFNKIVLIIVTVFFRSEHGWFDLLPASAPPTDSLKGEIQSSGNGAVVAAIGGKQHNAATPDLLLRAFLSSHCTVEKITLFL